MRVHAVVQRAGELWVVRVGLAEHGAGLAQRLSGWVAVQQL